MVSVVIQLDLGVTSIHKEGVIDWQIFCLFLGRTCSSNQVVDPNILYSLAKDVPLRASHTWQAMGTSTQKTQFWGKIGLFKIKRVLLSAKYQQPLPR
jgi:hypothetical protein